MCVYIYIYYIDKHIRQEVNILAPTYLALSSSHQYEPVGRCIKSFQF